LACPRAPRSQPACRGTGTGAPFEKKKEAAAPAVKLHNTFTHSGRWRPCWLGEIPIQRGRAGAGNIFPLITRLLPAAYLRYPRAST
jgi:hypothetical protein